MRNVIIVIYTLFVQIGFGQEIYLGNTFYGTRDGLNSQEVYCTMEDRNGFVWFGTDDGVSRFDGYEFTNYSIKDGLVNGTVFDLYEDYRGRIWFLGFGRSICYFENDSIHPYAYNDVLEQLADENGWISKIHIDTNEILTYSHAFWGKGAIDKDGNLLLTDPLVPGAKEHLMTLPNGEKVLIGYLHGNEFGGDVYYKWGDNDPVFFGDFERMEEVFSLVLNSEECFFVSGAVCCYIREDEVKIKKREAKLSSVAVDERGYFWTGTDNNGIEIYENIDAIFTNTPPIMTLFEGFNVSKILMQKNGAVWLSIENNGICYIYNYYVDNYKFKGDKMTEVSAICQGEGKDLYYGTSDGRVFHVDSINNHKLIINAYSEITALDFRSPNHFYVSTFSGIKNYWVHKDFTREIDFLFARNFCTTASSTWEIKSRILTEIVDNEIVFQSEGVHFFKAIYADSEGSIWIGGNEGLFKYDGEKINKQNALIGNKPVKINFISGYGENTLLIATKNQGLIFLIKKGEEYSHYTLPISDFIKDVFIDESKTLWLATNRGIIKVNIANDGTYTEHRINHFNGLLSDNVRCIEGVGDYIYAGTNQGLVKFNKFQLVENKLPPKIYLQSLQVNQKTMPISADLRPFKHDQNYFEFSFVALSYSNAGKVDYRYKLSGVDSLWQYTQSRSVRYPSLQAGDYTFMVGASNESGTWSQNQEIKFTIQSPFWKTKWFIFLIALLSISAMIWLLRIREKRKRNAFEKMRQLEEQKRKVIEAKLLALRSQMNPHFTFNALTAIQNVMLNFTMNEAVNYMSSFSELMRRILENSQKMHISIEEEIAMLKLYIKLENLRFDNSITCEFSIDPSIEAAFIDIPSMIIQPFVENAIIHGLAPKKLGEKKIRITLLDEKDQIFCSIEDTGIGREASQEIRKTSGIEHQSFGIKITEERLKLFDSDTQNSFPFEIIDRYDENGNANGTTVKVWLKKRNSNG